MASVTEDSVGMGHPTDDEHAYFQERAAWHRNRAAIADDSGTSALHRKFADLYDARSRPLPG